MQITGLLELVVVTLNVWGLPQIGPFTPAPLRVTRLDAICERLQAEFEKPDGWAVVMFQEVWLSEDRRRLSRCGFPYFSDLDDSKRPLDSGLLTLSRYPIVESFRFQFASLSNTEEALSTGESLARKSVLLSRVLVKNMTVWFASTHLIAQYETPDAFVEIRKAQFLDFVRWTKLKAGDDPLVLGGDWNFSLEEVLWNRVKSELDGFLEAPESKNACTVCRTNLMGDHPERKIDHLMARGTVSAAEGKVVFDEVLEFDGVRVNYSDHYGWRTRFDFLAP